MKSSSLHFRPGSGAAERDRIEAFARALPDRHIHVLDLPYRLASPAYGSSDVALWETDRRELAAFAVWQPAFKMLDYGMDPGHGAGQLGEGLIDWIDSWFGQHAQAVAPLTCWLKVGDANRDLVPLLERRGFTRCAWSIVHLERPLGAEARPELPPGFSIRAGSDVSPESWAALHRAVFPRVGMSAEWRIGITQSSWYRGNLDLIVVSSDERAVAFCGAWAGNLQNEQVAAEIEPLGTHPEFRGKRLGRAVLEEVMRRMAAEGVTRVFVEPWDDNVGAVCAYESLGFRPTFTIPTFAKQYP